MDWKNFFTSATGKPFTQTWQTCPHCGGNGKEPTAFYNTTVRFTIHDCTVCNGMKIISMLTGRPPIKPENF